MKSIERFVSSIEDLLFNHSAGFYLVALSIGIFAGAAVSYELFPTLTRGFDSYRDFVPGLITYAGYYKGGEHHVFMIGIVVMLTIVIFSSLLPWFRISGKNIRKAVSPSPLMIIVGIASWYVGRRYVGSTLFPYERYVALGCALLLCIIFWKEKVREIRWRDAEELFVGVISGFFAPLGITVALFVLHLSHPSPQSMWYIARVSAVLPVAIFFIDRSKIFSLQLYPPVVRLLQALSALLILRSARFEYDGSSGPIALTMNTAGTWSLVAIAVGVALAIVFSNREARGGDRATLSPLAAGAIASYFAFYFPVGSPLDVDDFHLGELSLPWQQIVQLGQRSYSEFVSVQGFLGLGIGLFNNLFFSGELATFFLGEVTMRCTVAFIMGALIVSRIEGIGGLLLLPLSLPVADRFYALIIGFFLLADELLLSMPFRWLGWWLASSLFALLWNPGSGVAFCAASAPVVLRQIINGFQNSWWSKKENRNVTKLLWIALLVIGVVIAPIVWGALQFVRENGITNTEAFSIPYFTNTAPAAPPNFQHFKEPLYNLISWEAIRICGWIVGVGVLVAALFRLRERFFSQVGKIYWIGTTGVLFSLALFPYAMGRIDSPFNLSRPGFISFSTLTYFVLPVVMLLLRRGAGIGFLSIGSGILGLCYGVVGPSQDSIIEKATTTIHLPPPYEFHTTERLGSGFFTREQLRVIGEIEQTITPLLKQGETYFDLTNRSALYLALGRRVPSPYSATYITVNRLIQDRIRERLDRENPPVVFLPSPGGALDRAPAGLRAYRIVSWFYEHHYRLYSSAASFLLRPDRYREVMRGKAGYTEERTEEENATLSLMLSERSLEQVPYIWGKSWGSLSRLVREGDSLEIVRVEGGEIGPRGGIKVEANSVSITLHVKGDSSLSESDFLSFSVERVDSESERKAGDLRLALHFASEKLPGGMCEFQGREGRYVVPIGHYPRIRFNPDLQEVTLTLQGLPKWSWWRISDVKTYRLLDMIRSQNPL